ncbi:tetratricopeptide repeat protein [filamentous cyanobacterium LEGE 07170]|nr:tetratricopeptide repeat protein [filamentous cyanobacterium LEGE 07170]
MGQGRQRLDDVARDVFRQALFQDDPELFQQTHQFLADYCKAKADAEVSPDAPYPARYENPDWRTWRADYLYHLLTSRNSNSQLQFRTHLLEARYFQQDEVVGIPLNAIVAEFELADHPFLSYADRIFLKQIQPAVQRGWAVLEEYPINYPYNLENYGLSKQETEKAIKVCLQPLNPLSGLAKFTALLFQAQRCSTEKRFAWLQQARVQAETLITPTDLEFSSGLFLWRIGTTFSALGCKEEAIANYDKAIEINPNDHLAWTARGIALSALGRKEEAIANYDKAIEIDPDFHYAWNNRGITLADLGRKEEAIDSCDKALELKPDDHLTWIIRGIMLTNLDRKEEAIASYDKSLEIKPDNYTAWSYRGTVLADLGRPEEAIASYDKALEIKRDEATTWVVRGFALERLARYEDAIESYNKSLSLNPEFHQGVYSKACCYALWSKVDEAIEMLQKAIEIDANYREQAKTDTDFDGIREDAQFRRLVEGDKS